MATAWFVGDIHRGHKNIHKHREFPSQEEHDALIKENYHKVVTKRDTVYFMGDTAFTHEALEEIKSWTAESKVLIVGNHDLERGITMQDLVNTYDKVYSFVKYKEFWLSHAPIHPEELRGRVNIHGHVHGKTLRDCRYFNTSLENIGYTPVNVEAIRSGIKLLERLEGGWNERNRAHINKDIRFLFRMHGSNRMDNSKPVQER